jgi:uncharacterized protein
MSTGEGPEPGQQRPGHEAGHDAPSGQYAPPSYGAPSGQYPPPGHDASGRYPTVGAYPTGETVQFGVTEEERNWAMAAHLSSVLGVWAAFLGAVGPLVVLLAKGDRSPFIRSQAVEALNFNISVLLYSVAAWILVFVLIGIPILVALFVFWLVFTVVATVKVSHGQAYRYPLTIRLVH